MVKKWNMRLRPTRSWAFPIPLEWGPVEVGESRRSRAVSMAEAARITTSAGWNCGVPEASR